MPTHSRLPTRPLAVLAVLISLAIQPTAAQDLTVAAASDLQSVLPEVVSLFQKETRKTVRVTFGSSGNFFAQIQNGAPFDLYFSADIDYPQRLERQGLAEPGTLTRYGVGRIVLWAMRDSGVDVTQGMKVLASPGVRRIAIANPEHAPYGRAAVAALRSAGIYDQVRTKLVLGENISQAAQFVRSGNAQAGIVALSVARTPTLASGYVFYEIPAASYPPIGQAAIVVKNSRNKPLAAQFLQMFHRADVIALMRRFGFDPPRAP